MATSIKEKIQKLLALATSPNENEAQAALLKAKELMAKHKMSEDDFNTEERKLRKCLCSNISWTSDSGRIWMTDLCKVLGDNNCCSCSWYSERGRRTYTLVIVGIGEDVDVCKGVIEYAVDFVNSAIKHMQKTYKGFNPGVLANSYATGFIAGLKTAFEEQEKEHPEWGLVVVKPEEVNDYEKGLRTKSVKSRQSDFNPLAYMRGQEDGKSFNPNRVIGEGN